MKKHRVIVGVVLVLGALVSARESAAQNIDLMAKWTAATVVNHKVVADFSGEAVLFTADGLPGRGMVTDRFEVEFDWNQSEFAMIGTPIIKNFPSKLVLVLKNGTCTTTVSGAFEHATIVELRNDAALGMANAVHAEVQRGRHGRRRERGRPLRGHPTSHGSIGETKDRSNGAQRHDAGHAKRAGWIPAQRQGVHHQSNQLRREGLDVYGDADDREIGAGRHRDSVHSSV